MFAWSLARRQFEFDVFAECTETLREMAKGFETFPPALRHCFEEKNQCEHFCKQF
jgi:hypothetical protein